MIKERFFELKKLWLSKEIRKIVTTAAIILAVCIFFIWLGVGMYVSVPEIRREELFPLFLLYTVFPGIILVLGSKRVYDVLNGREEPDDDPTEEPEEETEE